MSYARYATIRTMVWTTKIAARPGSVCPSHQLATSYSKVVLVTIRPRRAIRCVNQKVYFTMHASHPPKKIRLHVHIGNRTARNELLCKGLRNVETDSNTYGSQSKPNHEVGLPEALYIFAADDAEANSKRDSIHLIGRVGGLSM